ncbi:LuxE/PaaK family acyltransferase [Reichenbachiella ulvae]|uniref:Acyl transferase n=1 Tax=Reichenbachiella ulvae TaxID=2980104 RepID=A0ABT3CTD5_9BACT|nr:acyl transferase [Reichenbachiella ulvae]MCV9386784.1 acyl transferase [Reichenbachiella ulvae]
MKSLNSFKRRVTNLQEEEFEDLALDIFKYQAQDNLVYSQYLEALNLSTSDITSLDQIPFLPIEFFKDHKVVTGNWHAEKVFKSSGTTGMTRSCHYMDEIAFYQENSRNIFEFFFGDIDEYCFFALLPSYQEQGNSSLIAMVDYFMSCTQNDHGGYFLDDLEGLIDQIKSVLRLGDKKVVLFGVGYALLDLCKLQPGDLDNLLIIETGGMKGRREELTKEEFYEIMRSDLGKVDIFSEYGMTELLSQAYSDGNKFRTPASMRVFIRDINDPFSRLSDGKVGGVNVIDLANIHSCSFIETKDLGRMDAEGRFEILGRIDNSDIRGCNLLVV